MQETTPASLERYSKVAKTIRAVFESQSQRPVSDTTYEAWQVLGETVHVFDTRLDSLSDPVARKELLSSTLNFYDESTDSLDREGEEVREYLAHLKTKVDSLPEQQRASFRQSIGIIFDITEQLKTTTDLKEYARLRKLEGQVTSKLYTAFLPADFKAAETYPQLHRFFTRIGRVGNILDSVIDIPADFKSGEVKIMPSLANRFKLIGNSFGDVAYVVRHSSSDLRRKMIKSVRRVYKDRPAQEQAN
jgi:hypothetical protein